MRIFWKFPLSVLLLSAPLLAGSMFLEIGKPANPEAAAKGAVLVTRITACHSPEKTVFSATAEGLTKSGRQSVPLKLISLSSPDTFGIAREWPESGEWVVKIVATNPEYKNYATGVLIPIENGSFEWAAVKHYYGHGPTNADADALLGTKSGDLKPQ